MCGIVGYAGDKQAQAVLLNCLEKLEYRGYDSCGVAIDSGEIRILKDIGRVKDLRKLSINHPGTTGIGHTRWATHGVPTKANAHPHPDCTETIAVVHNGVITNHTELREQLREEGHVFLSDTDTEVIPHLIEKHYHGNLYDAVQSALLEIEGSYAVIAVKQGDPGLIAARKDSPLIIGIGDRENFIASDAPAILEYTDRVVYLEDGDIAIVSPDMITIRNNGNEVRREEGKIAWTVQEAEKAGYEHFMLKEIHEQPKVIRNTLAEYSRSADSMPGLAGNMNTGIDSLLLLAAGTSYYAALTGKYIIEDLLKIPVRVEISSEFSYYSQTLARNIAIGITQSGETADTIKAVKKLKEAGCRTIALTNVVGSSISRIADDTIYTRAGPEISVAATKTFVAQLMVLYWLALSHSNADSRKLANLLIELRQLPGKVQQVLDEKDGIPEIAGYLAGFDNAIYIGRGNNYPIALEGALKIKEISYIHAEGYAAGETKHGPFALLGKHIPVVAIAARDSTYDAMLTNIKEIKARGSPIIALAEEGDDTIDEIADHVINLPKVDSLFTPVVNIVALQLLAYYTARHRGCPIDYPRNLAKSVTVE